MSEFRRGLMMAAQGGVNVLPKCLCFTALEDGTFTLTIGASVGTNSYYWIEYSIDDGKTWTRTQNVASTQVVVTTPTIAQGKSVYWRGSGARMCASNSSDNAANLSIFSSTGKYNVSGLLMSLLLGDNATVESYMSNNYSFSRLFQNNTNLVDASGLVLSKNTKNNSYDYFFLNCTNLIHSPRSLSSAEMTNYCFRQFFYGCTSLIDAPELPASTLAAGAYHSMFYNCSKIRYIKMLATNVSATNCLYSWVSGMSNTNDFVFVKHINATWTGYTLSNWKIIYYDPFTDKYYLSDKTTECDDHGNVINA